MEGELRVQWLYYEVVIGPAIHLHEKVIPLSNNLLLTLLTVELIKNLPYFQPIISSACLQR